MAKKKEAEYMSWDMQPRESVRAYTMFCWYKDSIYAVDERGNKTKEIDITKRRSYRETAKHFKANTSNVQAYMTKFHWVERCEEYDRYIALCVRQENDKKIKKMLNNHATLGAAMVSRAAQRFVSMTEEEIEASDAIRMADVGVKIERQARGIGADETTVILSTPAEQAEKPSADIDVKLIPGVSKLSEKELTNLEDILDALDASDSDE